MFSGFISSGKVRFYSLLGSGKISYHEFREDGTISKKHRYDYLFAK